MFFYSVGVWVVYFINEGVGPLLNFTGLHIVTIRTTNLTFNIHNFYNGKHLLAWEHCKIRRSGCVGPLVFLEIGSRCQGGPGVLWMYYPAHLAQEFRESLNRLAVYITKLCTNELVSNNTKPYLCKKGVNALMSNNMIINYDA